MFDNSIDNYMVIIMYIECEVGKFQGWTRYKTRLYMARPCLADKRQRQRQRQRQRHPITALLQSLFVGTFAHNVHCSVMWGTGAHKVRAGIVDKY
jgi:hypothetical protein